MTPLEAKAYVEGLLDDVSAVLGGEWEVADAGFPDQCNIGTSTDGLYFQGARVQEGRSDYDEATNRVLRYWQSLGFALETASFAPDHRLVGADLENGAVLDYKLDAGRMKLSGSSPCVPGDWLAVRRQIDRDVYGINPDDTVAPENE